MPSHTESEREKSGSAHGFKDSPAIPQGEAKAATPNDTAEDCGEAAIRLGESKLAEPNVKGGPSR